MCALRLARARNQARDMRAGAKGAHARACDTREKGTRRWQAGGWRRNGTERDGGTTMPETPMRNDSFMPEPTIGYEPCA